MIRVTRPYCNKCNKYFKRDAPKDAGECPNCNSKRVWKSVEKYGPNDIRYEKVFTNIAYKENIRVSRSMGIAPSQLEEAKQRCPGTEWKRVGESLCPVIHNRPEKLKVAKALGMVEYDPKQFKDKS